MKKKTHKLFLRIVRGCGQQSQFLRLLFLMISLFSDAFVQNRTNTLNDRAFSK